MYGMEEKFVGKAQCNPNLVKQFPPFRELLKLFTTRELMVWNQLSEQYEKELRQSLPSSAIFNSQTEEGKKCWKDLKARVVEHVSYDMLGLTELFIGSYLV